MMLHRHFEKKDEPVKPMKPEPEKAKADEEKQAEKPKRRKKAE